MVPSRGDPDHTDKRSPASGPLIDSFMTQHPGIRIHLLLNDAVVDLVQEGFDVRNLQRAIAGPRHFNPSNNPERASP